MKRAGSGKPFKYMHLPGNFGSITQTVAALYRGFKVRQKLRKPFTSLCICFARRALHFARKCLDPDSRCHILESTLMPYMVLSMYGKTGLAINNRELLNLARQLIRRPSWPKPFRSARSPQSSIPESLQQFIFHAVDP